jgi:Pretoxin HINT domain/A nuclease of the HNH/ENDO VII superfamily with conserved WHH
VPGGFKSIEELKVGDAILSRAEDHPNGPVRESTVEKVFKLSGQTVKLVIQSQTVVTTGEHPFYVEGRGWVKAFELAAGDWLATEDGRSVVIESAEATGQLDSVYNVRVAQEHTYFVGSHDWGFAIWVHNQYAVAVDAAGNSKVYPPGVYKVKDIAGNFAREYNSNGELVERTFANLTDAHSAAGDLNSLLKQSKLYDNVAAAKGFPGIKRLENGYGPDFSGTKYLHPDVKTPIENTYTGKRSSDFEEANIAAGHPEWGKKAPENFVWHHVGDYDSATGKGTLQLVEREAHNATKPHWGGVKRYEESGKGKYGS